MQEKSWILNTLPNGVTHLTMPFINEKHIKPCRNSQTSNTPPSRKNQAIDTGQNVGNLM